MPLLSTILALAGPPQGGEPNPMASLVLMVVIFSIFYFVLILPMRNKQKKLEQLVRGLKSGDRSSSTRASSAPSSASRTTPSSSASTRRPRSRS